MRAGFRLARLGLHLLWGALTIALVYPWVGAALRRSLKRRWSRQLLAVLGVRLRLAGSRTLPVGMLVANHVSWLDIFVINALAPTAFVAKDEVRHWPLIGWLCAHSETIFLQRGSRAAAQQTRARMISVLRSGVHVGVFPEGTTTDGSRVLPFHAALFQSAIDARVAVVPLALRYVDVRETPSRAPAYDGEVTLWQSLLAIARSDDLIAELHVLAPLTTATTDRRHLAALSQHVIAARLGRTTASPSAPPPDHRESEIPGDLRVAPQ